MMWYEQLCPDDAPDGRCWDCRQLTNDPHLPDCPTHLGVSIPAPQPMYVYCQRCKRHHRTDRPTPHVPLPVYRASIIPACPRCGGDLEDEGGSYWCPACRDSVSPLEAMNLDEGDLDD